VDMRPYLKQECRVSQAVGTVTVGSVVSRQATEAAVRTAIRQQTGLLTKDLWTRIKRGEAHRQSSYLASGQFGSGAPSATVEISNHGEYATSRNETVLLGQRFDGYDGLSLAAHSESGSGILRLAASAPGFPADFVQWFVDRVLKLMALTSEPF